MYPLCNELVKNCFVCFGIFDEEEASINASELNKRLSSVAREWIEGDRKDVWSFFTQGIDPRIPDHIQKAFSEQIQPGLAIELGCGNSAVVSKLLQRGWKVVAVDNSPEALTNLQMRISKTDSARMKNLTLVCADMETYQFPDNVQLIVAKDSFPYCNPSKIVEVWDKAYQSLQKAVALLGIFSHDLVTLR